MSIFQKRKTFIIVKEGLEGIECFADDNLKAMNKPVKKLIVSFLSAIIEDLKDEK